MLTEHSAGSLTSQAQIKAWHHQAELAAQAAETASVAARWLQLLDYNRYAINEAWHLLSLAEFHDILPGTSLPQCYDYSFNDLALARNLFEGTATDAVAAIAAKLDTKGQGIPVVVYNPLPHDREDVVEVEVDAEAFGEAPMVAVGPDGRVTSCEVTGSSGNSALDQAACRNLQRRGRFEPALDRDGNPVASTYTKRVVWRLPQD